MRLRHEVVRLRHFLTETPRCQAGSREADHFQSTMTVVPGGEAASSVALIASRRPDR
jgi:hypothetical protein